MDAANCRPGDRADLVKLAKQVEALTQKAKDADKGKGSDHDSHKGEGKSDGKNSYDNAGKNGGGDSGRGHDKSGCWHAT
jgi:hypothetical protein